MINGKLGNGNGSGACGIGSPIQQPNQGSGACGIDKPIVKPPVNNGSGACGIDKPIVKPPVNNGSGACDVGKPNPGQQQVDLSQQGRPQLTQAQRDFFKQYGISV